MQTRRRDLLHIFGRRQRGILSLTASAVLLVLAVSRLVSSGTARGSGGPSASAVRSAIVVRKTISVSPVVLAASSSLKQPQEAVSLPNGNIVVADTGNKRVVLLNAHGSIIRSITGSVAKFQEPYAVVAWRNSFYVLDTQLRALESFDFQGRFQSQVFYNPVLDHPRGLALDSNGTFYIADPGSSSIVVASHNGTLIRKLSAPTGPNQYGFNQPSDVGVNQRNVVFVLDNGNLQVRALTPQGKAVGTWPAPGSTTSTSVHVLPLPDGRLLLSDPGGSLLLYARGSESATRIQLHVPTASSTPPSPVGLSMTPRGKILVTDNSGGRLLVVSLPPA